MFNSDHHAVAHQTYFSFVGKIPFYHPLHHFSLSGFHFRFHFWLIFLFVLHMNIVELVLIFMFYVEAIKTHFIVPLLVSSIWNQISCCFPESYNFFNAFLMLLNLQVYIVKLALTCMWVVGQGGEPWREMSIGLCWPAQFQGPFSQFWAQPRFGFSGQWTGDLGGSIGNPL